MYNEVYHNQKIRKHYQQLVSAMGNLPSDVIRKKKQEAEETIRNIGITFSVYSDLDARERLIPFDMFPRLISSAEWKKINDGIIQRAQAINAFLRDIYHTGEILRAGIIPKELVYQNPAFDVKMIGFDVPHHIYAPIIGSDIVRTSKEGFSVLEDNCRIPSGVSYMIENREIMMRMFPEILQQIKVEGVDSYPQHLLNTLCSLKPKNCYGEPKVVLLTPGPMNSAYYEHSYLADTMGIELVQGTDLFVDDGITYMMTTTGPKRVDIIYRRIDDKFLDPLSYDNSSLIGIPGLFNSYKSHNLSILSAPGSGLADDKAIYSYMPDIIRFYLGESPILDNICTWRCHIEDERKYVLDNITKLVVKEVHGAGGYGMLIGDRASKNIINKFKNKIKNNPSNYIAQPILNLSTVPIFNKSSLEQRHVDFRPFCLVGQNFTKLVSGGLTRVALKKGSLVVNSSQGGGVKDTWVLAE